MRGNLIPRKHRKHVLAIIKEFENSIGEHDELYKNWEEFLIFKYVGTQDGWLDSSDKKYQALRWLKDIHSFMISVWGSESDYTAWIERVG